jgi:hypothetical protein
MDLREIVWCGMDCIDLAQDGDHGNEHSVPLPRGDVTGDTAVATQQ